MAKERSVLIDYAVYLAIRALVCVLQLMPLSACRALAEGLAVLAYTVDKRHRLVALENLRLAFPNRYTAAELDQLVRAVYRHFCLVLVEIVHLPRILHTENWRRYVTLVAGERMVDCLTSGRPLLIVTGHFGNWEMAGYVLGVLGFQTYAIARPLDNPLVDAFFLRFRQKTGQTILAKHGDFERIQDVLRQGGVIATLADQDAGQRGLFVDFFGRTASTHKAVALLALEHDVPMAVVGVPRVAEPMRYEIRTEDVIDPREYAGRPDALKAMTQRFTLALEQLIRRQPEQYFWLHRRWKHQPLKRKGKQAA
jgi:Kdo2-lipid IVA lauroyltransferase/acyltransferase